MSPAPLKEHHQIPVPAWAAWGERNSLSQLGHLHLQSSQAPEDCSSPANIFPDIFCGCTIYSVVQSHEICRAFHGNHRGSFLLKETASNRKRELYQCKINLRKSRKPIKTNPAPRSAALLEQSYGNSHWMHYGTRQKEQEGQSKNLFSLCLTCLCLSLPH